MACLASPYGIDLDFFVIYNSYMIYDSDDVWFELTWTNSIQAEFALKCITTDLYNINQNIKQIV